MEVAFGLPGVHNLALWRELGESPIRLVGVRHEQTAAYAADGYARASGRLGVALTTTGPGAANTLAAVGEAWASRQPILVIATDIPTTRAPPGVWRGALHEATDQAAMFMPVVKEESGCTGGRDRPGGGRGRAHRAGAARAPGLRGGPTDLLAAEDGAGGAPAAAGRLAPAAGAPRRSGARARAPRARPPAAGLGRRRRAPGGRRRGGARLAERLVAPVMLTYSARGLLPPGHPCLVEAPPHVPEVGALWDEADCRGGDGQRLRRDDDPGLEAAPAAAPGGDQRRPARRRRRTTGPTWWSRPTPPRPPALAERLGERGGLEALGRRVRELNARSASGSRRGPEALAFLDAVEGAARTTRSWCATCASPATGSAASTARPRRASSPIRSAGARSAAPFPQGLGRGTRRAGPAVSISGDGGFLYACGELAAAKQEHIPLTAVIVDDGGYGMIRFDQDLHGDPREGSTCEPGLRGPGRSFGVARGQRGRARRALRGGAEGPRGAAGADDAGGAGRAGAAAERVAALVPAMNEDERGPGGAAGGPARAPRRRGERSRRAPSSWSRPPRSPRGICGRARAHHRHGPADPPDLGRRVARLAGRHGAARALAALLRPDLGGDHARPDGRRAPPPRRGARHRRVGGDRDRGPARGSDRHRHLAGGRGHRLAMLAATLVGGGRCSRHRRAPRRCWWPRSSRPRGLRLRPRPRRPCGKRHGALVGSLLLPVDPVRLVREALGPVLDRLVAVLDESRTRSSSATPRGRPRARRRGPPRRALRPPRRDARGGGRRRPHLASAGAPGMLNRLERYVAAGRAGLAIENVRALAARARRARSRSTTPSRPRCRGDPRAGHRLPRAANPARGGGDPEPAREAAMRAVRLANAVLAETVEPVGRPHRRPGAAGGRGPAASGRHARGAEAGQAPSTRGAAGEARLSPRRAGSRCRRSISATSICAFWSLPA